MMPQSPRRDDPERIRQRLLTLFEDFREKLERGDLRERFRALIPAFRYLRDPGVFTGSQRRGNVGSRPNSLLLPPLPGRRPSWG